MKNPLRTLLLLSILFGVPSNASAIPILVTWTGYAEGAPGSLVATGTITVDSTEIYQDISLNGLALTGSVFDGVNTYTASLRQGGADTEMALRFTSYDLNNLAAVLVDTNHTDTQNDSLVFEFSPWPSLSQGSCACNVALIVLHGVDARFAPSPLFISADPVDLRGDYAFSFEVQRSTVPEPTTGLLLLAGFAPALLWRRRR